MSRLPQAGPTSDRLQKRGTAKGSKRSRPEVRTLAEERCSDPMNPKKDRKDGIAGPAHHGCAHKGPGSRVCGGMLRLL